MTRTINPRKYRHRVVIHGKDETTVNAMNEVLPSDTIHARRFARIITRGALERETANQTMAERTHRFGMLSDAKTRAITPKMTIAWDSRTFEILGMWDIDGEQREVMVDCKEMV